MPIVVTTNNTGRTLTRESWNWVAHQSFLVTGVGDENSALNAVGLGGGAAYPFNGAMLLRRYYAENYKNSPQAFTVHAEYAFGDHGQLKDTPLDELPKRIWQPDRQLIPVDYDTSFNPMLNSSGDIFEQPIQRPVPTIAVVFQQYIPLFNVAIPFQFQDRINSNAMNYVDIGPVGIGLAYCDYIKPVQYYTSNAPYVLVEYRIKFLPSIGSDPPSISNSPWQPRVKDVGRSGFATISGKTVKGPFVDDTGTPVPSPLMLNGQGKPILAGVRTDPTDASTVTTQGYWVLGPDRLGLYSPINNPTPPPGLTKDTTLSNSNQTILILENIPASDFSMMGIA